MQSKGETMKLKEILSEYGVEDQKLIDALVEYESDFAKGTVPVKVLNKKVAQYHELQEKLSEAEVNLEKMKETDVNALKKTNEDLKGRLFNFKNDQWQTVKKKLTDESLKEKFEKVKGKFIFAEEGKTLEIEEIEKNLQAFKTYDEIDYFTSKTSTKQNFNSPPPSGKTLPKPVNPYRKSMEQHLEKK